MARGLIIPLAYVALVVVLSRFLVAFVLPFGGLCLGAEPSITASAAAALAERGEYVGVSDVLGIRVRSRGPVPRVECFNAGWNWDFVA